jgi:hypothetical protein
LIGTEQWQGEELKGTEQQQPLLLTSRSEENKQLGKMYINKQ